MLIEPYDVEGFHDKMTHKGKTHTEYRSKNTIIWNALLELPNYDWGRNEWDCYLLTDEELAIIRPRLNKKIEKRYGYREIGVIPPAAFHDNLVRNIDDAMATHGLVYKELIKGLDITNNGTELIKEVDTHSKFPQSRLSSTKEDYFTSSDEHGKETTNSGNQIKAIETFGRAFNEPDAAVLDWISVCFSNLYSLNF
jgi:hypothetical protein